MFFIRKSKVRRTLLQLMNAANADRKTVRDNPNATEQEKRDAFMFASGCAYCAINALNALIKPRGEDNG